LLTSGPSSLLAAHLRIEERELEAGGLSQRLEFTVAAGD
jgi:hypothetical protein